MVKNKYVHKRITHLSLCDGDEILNSDFVNPDFPFKPRVFFHVLK